MSSLDILTSACAFILVLVLYLNIKQSRTSRANRLPLPPGPQKRPLIGNLLDVPPQPWITYQKWCKEFSKCFFVHCKH